MQFNLFYNFEVLRHVAVIRSELVYFRFFSESFTTFKLLKF
jgi:hypothetical protein